MTEMSLAEEIIDAGSDAERRRLLTAATDGTAEHLSDEIRDLCIASWSSDPTRVQRSAAALRTISKAHPSDHTTANHNWPAGILKKRSNGSMLRSRPF
jgi:hypothetical protein